MIPSSYSALPSLRETAHRVILVSRDDNLAARLSEDLPGYDVDAVQFETLSDVLADLERRSVNHRNDDSRDSTFLIAAVEEISAQPAAARQRLAELTKERGIYVIGGRGSDCGASEAAAPVNIDDVLPFPFDYSEILGRVRHLLAYRSIERKANFSDVLLGCISEAVMITDRDDRIVWANSQFTRLTGYALQEVLGKRPRFIRSSQNSAERLEQITKCLEDAGAWRGEIWNRRKDGGVYAEWLTVSALRDANGRTDGYLSIFTDITDRKIREEHLEHQALHDPLTGLPNRLLLQDRFQLAVSLSERKGKLGALLFVDLDGFKEANDRYGHAAGDQVLIQLAARVLTTLRSADTVSRIGGDEFVCLLNELESAAEAEDVASKILEAATLPFLIEGHSVALSCSIGISVFPADGADFELLMQRADAAMYQAKGAGKNRFCRFALTGSSQ